MLFRERFDAFEGVLSNRNLIASYLPARAAADAPIEGVFEVCSEAERESGVVERGVRTIPI